MAATVTVPGGATGAGGQAKGAAPQKIAPKGAPAGAIWRGANNPGASYKGIGGGWWAPKSGQAPGKSQTFPGNLANAPANPTSGGHYVNVNGQWQLIHAIGPGKWAPGPPPKNSPNALAQPANPPGGGHYVAVNGRWQLIKATGPNQWKAVGNPSGTAPLPNNPQNSSKPDWMAPLTADELARQAQDTISKSYGPSYTNLDQQATEAQNIQAKRESDDKYYQSWLDSQGANLQSNANASQSQLSTMLTNLQNQQNTLYSGQSNQLIADANAREGNVSNNAQSTALNSQLAGNQTTQTALLNSALQQGTADMRTSSAALTAANANNTAVLQAGREKTLAAFQTTMDKIGQQRATLQSKQTGDIAKEISRLQGVEIQKAENTRSLQVAAQKLGVDLTKAELSSQTSQSNNQRTTAASQANNQRTVQQQNINNLRTNKTSAANNAANNSRSAANNAATNAQSNLNNLRTTMTSAKNAQLAAQTKLALAASKASGVSKLTSTQKGHIQGSITYYQGLFNQLVQDYGYTGKQAYGLLRNGGQVPIGGTQKNPKMWTLKPLGASLGADGVQVLNAAYNTSAAGGNYGLSGGDVNWLKGIGIDTSGYKVYQPASASQQAAVNAVKQAAKSAGF